VLGRLPEALTSPYRKKNQKNLNIIRVHHQVNHGTARFKSDQQKSEKAKDTETEREHIIFPLSASLSNETHVEKGSDGNGQSCHYIVTEILTKEERTRSQEGEGEGKRSADPRPIRIPISTIKKGKEKRI